VSDVLIRVRGLRKAYGERQVLDGVDFELRRRECLVIVGRSGSGKSVTLRQLNGLEKPDAGSIIYDGTEISRLEEPQLYPIRRRIAMLFQSGALFDSMDVFDNIAFPLREHTDLDEPGIAEVVRRKLAMVQLHGIEDRFPSALSGGMRKRVALARSLALDPEVMLYDEPTTGLDPVTSAAIGRLIRRTEQNLGMSSVLVTHDVALARTVGHRLAFIDRGRFRFLGTWQEAEHRDDPKLGAFLTGTPEVDDAD